MINEKTYDLIEKQGLTRTAIEFNRDMRHNLMILVGVLGKMENDKRVQEQKQRQINEIKGFLDKSRNLDILLVEHSNIAEDNDEYLSHILKNIKEIKQVSNNIPFQHEPTSGVMMRQSLLELEMHEAGKVSYDYDYTETQFENMVRYYISLKEKKPVYVVFDWGFKDIVTEQNLNLKITGSEDDVNDIIRYCKGLDNKEYPLLEILDYVTPSERVMNGVKEIHYQLIGDKLQEVYDLLSEQSGHDTHKDLDKLIPDLIFPIFKQHDNIVYCNRLKK